MSMSADGFQSRCILRQETALKRELMSARLKLCKCLLWYFRNSQGSEKEQIYFCISSNCSADTSEGIELAL